MQTRISIEYRIRALNQEIDSHMNEIVELLREIQSITFNIGKACVEGDEVERNILHQRLIAVESRLHRVKVVHTSKYNRVRRLRSQIN